jgi:hypothetical protein
MGHVTTLKHDIARQLKIGHLSQSDQDELLHTLMQTVLERTQLEIWKRLGADDRKVFAFLTEPEEIDEFMREKVPNIEDVMEMSAMLTVKHFQAMLM